VQADDRINLQLLNLPAVQRRILRKMRQDSWPTTALAV
jgi:hypothetical protein